MKTKTRLFVVILLSLVLLGKNAVAQTLKMDGVAGFMEGRAQVVLKEAFSKKGAEWISESFASAGQGKLGDPKIKMAVCDSLKKKMREMLPREVERLVAKDLLGGAVGRDEKEFQDIVESIQKQFDKGLDDKIDSIVGSIYDSAVARLEEALKKKGVSKWVDVTDIKGSVGRYLDLENIANIAADQLSKVIGESTVAGIRARVTDALEGKLPPEVIAALNRGPEEFEKYASKIEANLPGAKLSEIKNSILNRPLIKLPTPAYASMLAASAAVHFASAFKGVTVDAYELKRGMEVTRVMAWQIQNKEYISLSLMQLGSLARSLAFQLGVGANFDKLLSQLKKPLDKIEGELKKLDELVKKPLDEVRKELKDAVGAIKDELEKIQEKVLTPVREALNDAQDVLNKAKDAVNDAIPDKLNGIPKDWDELKRRAGQSDGNGPVSLGPEAEISDAEKVPSKNESLSEEMDPVLLHNGEFIYEAADLFIPARGLDFKFTRIYRGRSDFLGELGHNWTHSYAERLLKWNDGSCNGLTHVDARGRKYFFCESSKLARTDNGYELKELNGLVSFFDKDGRITKKRDRHGNEMVFEYGADGLLKVVTDALGRKVEFIRRDDGLITEMKDFAGRSFKYSYNDKKELVGATTPPVEGFLKGKTTAYIYTDSRLSMIMDPKGSAYLKNRYDDANRVTGQSYMHGTWMTAQYAEGTGEVATRAWVTDEEGVTRLYEHDAAGHLLRLWRMDGEQYALIRAYGYNENGEVSFECEASDHCFKYHYGDGELSSEVVKIEEIAKDTDKKRVTTIEREKMFGRPLLITFPAGDRTYLEYETEAPFDLAGVGRDDGEKKVPIARFDHDNFGRLTFTSDARGKIMKYEYYPDGGYLKEITTNTLSLDGRGEGRGWPSSNSTSFTYDLVGNITSITSPDGIITKFSVNALNQITSETKGDGPKKIYSFDANDELKNVEIKKEAQGTPQNFKYDYNGFGEVIRMTDPNGNYTEYTRDAAGRVVSRRRFDVSQKLLAAKEFRYDGFGNLTSELSGLWNDDISKIKWLERRYEYNAMGDVVASIDPLGSRAIFEYDTKVKKEVPSKARYEWDSDNRLIAITDAKGARTTFEYDDAGRLKKELYPNGTTRETFYDEAGRVIRSKDRNGSELVVTYDAAGNIISRKNNFKAEALGNVEEHFTYDGLGRLTTASSSISGIGTSEVKYSYDSLSRVVREEQSGETITREYDDADRMLVLRLPSNNSYFYNYDAEGRVAGVFGPNGMTANVMYDPAGNVVSGGFGDAVKLKLLRDSSGREHERSYFANGVLNFGIGTFYDDDYVAKETGYAGIERIYSRDKEARLISATDRYGPADEVGSERNLRRWDYAPEVHSSSNDKFSYDPAGNLISDGEREFRYDAFGRLIGVWKGGESVAFYNYDVFGRRVAVLSNGNVKKELWDGFSLVGKSGAGGNIEFAYLSDAHSPVARIEKDSVAYLPSNRMGTPLGVMGADGRAICRSALSPYGEPVAFLPASSDRPVVDEENYADCRDMELEIGLAGNLSDRETGLIYMRNRYLDPKTGRFITPDPLSFKVRMRLPLNFITVEALSYHRGQGGASHATFTNRPLYASPFYSAYPFGRSLEIPYAGFKDGETDLYLYAKGDPSMFFDPMGLASLLFVKSTNLMFLLDKEGSLLETYSAANNVTNPKADPAKKGGNGPFPVGTYALDIPEFYSESYRQAISDRYELGGIDNSEGRVTGKYWTHNSKDTKDYSWVYGGIKIKVGSPGEVPWERLLRIHGGRQNYEHKTLGCIRVDDRDLEFMAVTMIQMARWGDSVDSITVKD